MTSAAGQVRLWSLGGLSLFQLAKRTSTAFRQNHLDARSAQFAYYAMLASVPLLIITISSIALMPLQGMTTSFLSVLERGFPPDAYELLEQQIGEIENSSSAGLILIGLVVFVFAGARLFSTIGEGLNAAFGVPPRHRRMRTHGLALIMPLCIVALFLLAQVLLVVGPTVMQWALGVFERPGLEAFFFHAIRWVIVIGFLLVVSSLLYCFIPAVRVPWRWFTPGNVFAVAGWMLASQGFRIYVENFSLYNKTYGALGGVIVLLLWLYLAGAILFIGGQINGVIHQALGVDLATGRS